MSASRRALVLTLALLTLSASATWSSDRGSSLTNRYPKMRPEIGGCPSASKMRPMRLVQRVVAESIALPEPDDRPHPPTVSYIQYVLNVGSRQGVGSDWVRRWAGQGTRP